MEKVKRHFIFCLLVIVAPFLPHSRESESFLIGRGTINSVNLSSSETFVGKSETLFSPTHHNSYHTIKNKHNIDNNNNNLNKNNQKNHGGRTLSRIYEDHEEEHVYGGKEDKEQLLNFEQAHIVADESKFQDVRKTHHHHPRLYYKLFDEDTPWTTTREEPGATSAKVSSSSASVTVLHIDEVGQEEDLNETFKEFQLEHNYQLDHQYQNDHEQEHENEHENENDNENENERASGNWSRSLELDSDDWNSTLMNFRSKFPVKKWEAFGLFTEGYLNNINKHWLTFEPASSLNHHILATLYIIIMTIGCTGNFLVVFMFCRCRTLRTPANYLVVNLAVSDFIMLAKTPIFIINSFYEGPVFGRIGCQIYGFLGGLTGTASIMTLTSIAVDRYFVIVYPLNPYKKTTSRRALLMIVAVWFYAGFFSSMPLCGINEYTPEGYLTSCSFDYLRRDVTSRVFVFIFFLAAFCLPLTLIIFSYVAIFRMVVQAEKLDFFNGENSRESCKYRRIQEKLRKDVKIALLTTFIVIIWIVAWTPYAVVALLGIFGQEKFLTPLVSTLPALFCKAASVIDPFVYAISHPRFQREFRNKFQICFNRNKINGTIRRNLPNQTSFIVTGSSDSVNLDQTQIPIQLNLNLNMTGAEEEEEKEVKETFRKNPQGSIVSPSSYYSSSFEMVQTSDAVERDSVTEDLPPHDKTTLVISPNSSPKENDKYMEITKTTTKMTPLVSDTPKPKPKPKLNENNNDDDDGEKTSKSLLENDNPEQCRETRERQKDQNNFNKEAESSTSATQTARFGRRRSETDSYNAFKVNDNNNSVPTSSRRTRFLSMSSLTSTPISAAPDPDLLISITSFDVQNQNQNQNKNQKQN